MPKNRYGGVDTHAAFFVSIKAKSMIKTGLFRPEDKEDIEQELMMAYLKDEGNFKGDRAEKDVFTRMVINHRSIQMIREITADKRKVRIKEVSLDQPAFDDEDTLMMKIHYSSISLMTRVACGVTNLLRAMQIYRSSASIF